jgi:hypothetical protein
MVVPKNEEERGNILRQSEGMPPFPWRVVHSEGYGRDEFLEFMNPNEGFTGLYAFRFIKAFPTDKSLEDYM